MDVPPCASNSRPNSVKLSPLSGPQPPPTPQERREPLPKTFLSPLQPLPMLIFYPTSPQEASRRTPFFVVYIISTVASFLLLAVFCLSKLKRHWTIKSVSPDLYNFSTGGPGRSTDPHSSPRVDPFDRASFELDQLLPLCPSSRSSSADSFLSLRCSSLLLSMEY